MIDGTIFADPPQGGEHFALFLALQETLIPLGARGGSTVILSKENLFDPDYDLRELPTGEDVLWAVEVSVSSRATDLGPKKAGYAAAGVPTYWAVDALQCGVSVFTNPVDGEYRDGTFVPAGEPLSVPVVGTTLDTASIFPVIE